MNAPLLRFYDALVRRHLANYRQMAFISGPRQVGKTTTARHLAGHYLDWDNPAHRKTIAAGPDAVATYSGVSNLSEKSPILAIDEIHKFGRWKNWLKGYFDVYAVSLNTSKCTTNVRIKVHHLSGVFCYWI
jgi:hypothetical protein